MSGSIDPNAAASRAFFDELALFCKIWDLGRHPFLVRCITGESSRSEIAAFAARYGLAVGALARTARNVVPLVPMEVRADFAWKAEEREGHVRLWRSFRAGLPAVDRAVAAYSAFAGVHPVARRLPESLAVVYALEVTQTQAAQVQLAGLMRFSGFRPDNTPDYFRARVSPDMSYRELLRTALERCLTPGNPRMLLREVHSALAAQWDLVRPGDLLRESPGHVSRTASARRAPQARPE